MKILHTADLHLGAPMRAHLPPREAKLRRDELLSAFHRLLQLAEDEKCAAVLIAGDLFDSAAAAAMLASTVLGAIQKHSSIDFYYAAGNHEGGQWLPASLPKNFHVFGNRFSCFQKGNVCFWGKSFPKAVDFDNIYLQNNSINLMILHGAWADGRSENAEIPLAHLHGRGIDYLALGHYHSYAKKEIDARGIAVYCGCPEGRGFDELGQKGAVLIETIGARLTHRFIPLSGRVFHRIKADISDAKSVLDLFSICEGAVSHVASKDLVRLVLVGKKSTYAAPTDAILRHLFDRFYHLEVEDATVIAPDIDSIRDECSLRGEFVRTVMRTPALGEEERMRILSLGLSALHEEGGMGWS